MTLTVHVRPGRTPGWFQAFAPELPGCSASGPSVSEAVQRLRQRIDDHLDEARRRAPVPGARKLRMEV
ncbi:MAG: type II toxin-antitoxin system HicB family antitoxin [Deltaproteobacteria bacterium]|nr:type II toxin-antitoxin system HicB family antitoxin [Deltaproteobacteria bacterium]